MNCGERLARMRALLEAKLAPERIEIEDESALHAGHAGARGGAGHYRVLIVAQRFAGLGAVARHRLVYESLDDMMGPDIHALTIRALSPDER